jgi:hypothetical protein
MPDFVDRRAQPGYHIRPPRPESIRQRLKRHLGDELDKQSENENTQEQRSHLSQGSEEKILDKIQGIHTC